jgi:hypothetical protein
MQIGAWLLREVGDRVDNEKRRATLDPERWGTSVPLFLWEAFISGPGHARDATVDGPSEHVQDAVTAATAFAAWFETDPRAPSAVTADNPLATLGALALWAGWTSEQTILHESPVVIWPSQARAQVDSLRSAKADVLEPKEGSSDVVPEEFGEFRLLCGDSHSIWRSHQDANGRAAFEGLAGHLRGLPEQAVEAMIVSDGDRSAYSVRLRLVGENQISWKGLHISGSASRKVPIVVTFKRG